MSKNFSIGISFLLVVIGVAARLLPHAPNVTPLTAIALFAATYLGIRYAGMVLLATMVVSDLWIGAYSPGVMASVYGSLIIAAAIGLLVKKNVNVLTAGAGALGASVIFFIITNAAVWAFTPMYAHNFAGLMQSYTMAIPFFKNSLMGDLGYTAVLFGALELYKYYASKKLTTAVTLQTE